MSRHSTPDTRSIREGDAARGPQTGRRDSSLSLPPDMVEASIRRVGVVALAYAATFFMAGVVPSLIDPAVRGWFWQHYQWLPSTVSISMALLVALAMRADIGSGTKVRLGLLFEILGSYGIAYAEYSNVVSGIVYGETGTPPGGLGLS